MIPSRSITITHGSVSNPHALNAGDRPARETGGGVRSGPGRNSSTWMKFALRGPIFSKARICARY